MTELTTTPENNLEVDDRNNCEMELTASLAQLDTHLREQLAARPLEAESRRLFHGRGGCYQGLNWLVVDWFSPVLVVTLFREPPLGFELRLAELMRSQIQSLATSVDAVLVQYRFRTGAPFATLIGSLPSSLFAQRGDLRFNLSLQQQNVGFFLDIEPAREWLEADIAGKRVLNLFSYTCAFSVVALAAEAQQVVNIDMSQRALKVGRDNHKLNSITVDKVKFLAHDIFSSWGKLKRLGPYDRVIIDPPSFQKGSFVATKDYQRVLKKMIDLVAPGGQFLACLNAPEVARTDFRALVESCCPEFVWQQDLPQHGDFPDADVEKALKMLVFQRLS